tara:strand:- start:380 stop:526 length:147 start_codon:yes stop_codon:yes gene_type:complete
MENKISELSSKIRGEFDCPSLVLHPLSKNSLSVLMTHILLTIFATREI